jgi:hypothetical protein
VGEVTHPNKVKGNRAELAVATYLRTVGFPYAERSRAGWQSDRGDIDGIPGVVIEVKDCRKHDLSGWMAETEAEVANAGAVTGLLVVKRRLHTDPADWYAITRLGDWAHMAKDAGL